MKQSRELKILLMNGRKYLLTMYLIKVINIQNIQGTHITQKQKNTTKNSFEKMGKGSEQTIFQRRHIQVANRYVKKC